MAAARAQAGLLALSCDRALLDADGGRGLERHTDLGGLVSRACDLALCTGACEQGPCDHALLDADGGRGLERHADLGV